MTVSEERRLGIWGALQGGWGLGEGTRPEEGAAWVRGLEGAVDPAPERLAEGEVGASNSVDGCLEVGGSLAGGSHGRGRGPAPEGTRTSRSRSRAYQAGR